MKRVFLLLYLTALIPLDNTLTLQREREKRQTSCPSGSRLCSSGECISSNDLCDGVKNCTDRSDETRETCKELNYKCSNNHFKCDYGACIEKNKVCNQIEDCVDGSDEKNCLNSPDSVVKTSQEVCKGDSHKFPCKNKECIDSNLICDGEINCSDGSDEIKELCGTFVCPSFLFQCDYGGCIEKNRLCNGVNDCVDGSDESRCTARIYMKTTTTPRPTRPSKPCRNNEYKCKNNECINRDLICDGGKDCSDGSDETKALCKTPCIGNSFTCDYGGCISWRLRCNGISDCVDGSDESSKLCEPPTSTSTSRPPTTPTPWPLIPVTQGQRPCQLPRNPPNGIIEYGCKRCVAVVHTGVIKLKCNAGYTPENDGHAICLDSQFTASLTCKPSRVCQAGSCIEFETRPSTSCRYYQYKCKNNECIKRELICDGGKDCSDGSDETKELCKSPCPGDSFTCDYGGCIRWSLRCNGVSDCVDGSDESSFCEFPTFTFAARPPTTSPLNLHIQGVRPCQLPRNPPNGIIEYVCETCVTVVHTGAIRLKCNAGYTPEKEGHAICIDSRFTASLTCKPIHCPSVESLSTIATCYHNGNKLNNCKPENLILNSTVHYGCRYGYQLNDQPIENQNSICVLRRDGEAVWHPEIFHCVPECGLSPPKGTGFIVGGKPAIPVEHPWHCGVFKNKNNLFEQICGGTLVSGYFVLSAAHCFTEPNKPELYRIIFGKIHRSYGIHDPTQREYQIQKIINNPYFTEDVFEDDIAFIVLQQEVQFSATLMPACIDFQQKHTDLLLSAGSRGQVAGWGLTSNDQPSLTLQYTNLDYHNYQECRNNAIEYFKKFNTPRKFCAGTIGGSTVCPGDSGGGLMFKATEGPPNWYLMGIVSTGVVFGNNSCLRTQYTVFTSIRNQLEFINREFAQNAKLTFKDV